MGYWGFISVVGAGDLISVGPRFNARSYVNVLENFLKPQVRASMLVEDYPVIRVVQDNSAVHRAHIVQEWYEENPDFEKVQWPALAQDLNPIENVWGMMQRSWISGELRNREELQDKVAEVWRTVQNHENICQRLVHSMPARLREVIANKGYWTHY